MNKILNSIFNRLTFKNNEHAHAPLLKKHGWFGNYTSWIEANAVCSGYDSANILEKVKGSVLKVKNGEAVYERDSVLFDKVEYSENVLSAFKFIASQNNNSLQVVDFGGSLGSSYFQYRALLKNLKELKLTWSVVEQKHFVECGREFIEDQQLKFYYTIDETIADTQSKQILYLSSVIQYFENPYKLISDCILFNFDYIIIDRTAFIQSDNERITVQIVPDFIYEASYPSWFLNEQKFLSAFLPAYTLLDQFICNSDPQEKLEDGKWSYRKGFVFKRK